MESQSKISEAGIRANLEYLRNKRMQLATEFVSVSSDEYVWKQVQRTKQDPIRAMKDLVDNNSYRW